MSAGVPSSSPLSRHFLDLVLSLFGEGFLRPLDCCKEPVQGSYQRPLWVHGWKIMTWLNKVLKHFCSHSFWNCLD